MSISNYRLRMCFILLLPIILILLVTPFANVAAAMDTYERESVIQSVIDHWEGVVESTRSLRWEQAIRNRMQQLPEETLLSVLEVDTYEALMEILFVRSPIASADSFDPGQALAGQRYYPLTPCRLVDTRIAAGEYTGPISPSTSADYHAKDITEIANQGGISSDGCGVASTASAVVVNITATDQAGTGHLRAYPYSAPLPNAAILNFSGPTIGNSTILPICIGTCAYDFSIYARTSAHVIIDVMGYFDN